MFKIDQDINEDKPERQTLKTWEKRTYQYVRWKPIQSKHFGVLDSLKPVVWDQDFYTETKEVVNKFGSFTTTFGFLMMLV